LIAIGLPADVLTAERLSLVYGHPIDVLQHPRTGAPLILPSR
jgi:iron complex transport system ATP-binding protein